MGGEPGEPGDPQGEPGAQGEGGRDGAGPWSRGRSATHLVARTDEAREDLLDLLPLMGHLLAVALMQAVMQAAEERHVTHQRGARGEATVKPRRG